MLKRFTGCLSILIFLLLTGCTAFVKQPVVKIKDLSVVSLDGGGLGMELYLGVMNPNFYDVKLQGYSYDLKVMALPLAKGAAREEVKFLSKAETEVRIPIRVSYADFYELLKRRPDPDAIPYQLIAGLDLETPLGQMTVPVDRKGTYAIPKQFRPSGILNRVTDFLRMNR